MPVQYVHKKMETSAGLILLGIALLKVASSGVQPSEGKVLIFTGRQRNATPGTRWAVSTTLWTGCEVGRMNAYRVLIYPRPRSYTNFNERTREESYFHNVLHERKI